jgi:hypothetical protein
MPTSVSPESIEPHGRVGYADRNLNLLLFDLRLAERLQSGVDGGVCRALHTVLGQAPIVIDIRRFEPGCFNKAAKSARVFLRKQFGDAVEVLTGVDGEIECGLAGLLDVIAVRPDVI